MSHLLAGDAADISLYQIPGLQSPRRVPSCGSGGCVARFGRQTQSQAVSLLVNADDPCDDHLQKRHDVHSIHHALLVNRMWLLQHAPFCHRPEDIVHTTLPLAWSHYERDETSLAVNEALA